MLEKFSDTIQELKNAVSLRYVDSNMREKTLSILEDIRAEERSSQVCQQYIMKIEDTHERFMQNISSFIDSFSSSFSDFHHNFETLQQDFAQSSKLYQQERSQGKNMIQEMNDKMERLHRQIMNKDEQIRQVHLKLQERQAMIESLEKQSNQYLKRMENDFYKQQKALQQSYYIVTKLEEEIGQLKNQNQHLIDMNSVLKKSGSPILVEETIAIEEDREISDKKYQRDDDECSLVRCSMISSNSDRGLQQFEELHHLQARSREVFDSVEQQLPVRVETLKEMLNMSMQKEYRFQYNKCDSVQNKYEKQNYRYNQDRASKSKDRKDMWAINNSLQSFKKDCTQKLNIKQFNLPAPINNCPDNPYYFYFQIVSQNAKIHSQYFQNICSLSTQSQWQWLLNAKLPLHEWQDHIQKYLQTAVTAVTE